MKRLEIEGIEPESYALASILGEISTEENELGHGMLFAVVVHVDDGIPGAGFFILAKSLGRNIIDKDKFWLKELSDVHKYWSEHAE